MQKSAVVMNNLSPTWDETICVSREAREDTRTCFDIRDDFDPGFPKDRPPLLHFGCVGAEQLILSAAPIHVGLSDGATLTFVVLPQAPAPPPSPSPPPSPPNGPPPPPSPPVVCKSDWCDEFVKWRDDPSSKFHGMWGPAWQMVGPGEWRCWDGLGGKQWLEGMWKGTWCNRNWMEGSAADMGGDGMPAFSKPAPALLGFDETILGYCSELVGMGFDGGDLNTELAQRCVWANKNVLRLFSGARPWDMCQNIEWQMCALTGKLPHQDGRKVSFATAPRDLQLEWWTDPSKHPTYTPVWDGFALGDVYFAEVAVIFLVCANRAQLFELEVGETFVCEMDHDSFDLLTAKFIEAGRR